MRLLHGFANAQEPDEKRFELVEGNHIGAIAGRFVGIGMCFKEEAIDANGGGGAGQRFDHGAISTCRATQAAGFLHAVRGVEDDRHAERLHFGNGTHVVHQRP